MLMAERKLQYDEPYVYGYYSEPRTNSYKGSQKAVFPGKKVSSKYGLKSIALMFIIIGVFGLIGAKTVHTTVVKGAEIKALEKEVEALRVENDLLQVEVDKLRSIARIEKAALAMGMEKPEGTIYIASNLIQPEKPTGVEKVQPKEAVPEEKADSMLAGFMEIFTSFFASTQR